MTASGEDVLAAADTTPDKDERPTILLYAVEAVERLRAEDRYARESKTRMERLFNGMLESGGLRPLALVPEALRTALEQLEVDFPNFAEVIAVIRNHLVLRTLDGRAAVGFPPLLLGGSPGIGKTLFSRELAKCLDLPFRRIGFESAQNGAALSGSSSFWSNASPGELALQLIGSDAGSVGNPLILLDELDKIHPGLEYNPAAGLYPLLERHTAAHWQDQCLPIDLDASHVCWIGTANQLERIEAPILSRFQVFEVPDLTGAQARVVALRIYGLILAEESFGRHFAADLDAAVLDRLGAVAPRELRKVLIDALGKAACAGRRQLHPDDVAAGRPGRARQNPFGFCA
jgi:ATP-dependent Lon protease